MVSNLKKRLRAALLGKHQRILGDPSTLGSRILKWVIILSAMGAAAGVWFLLIQGVNARADSFSRVAPLVKAATSTWSYVVLELILLRGMLWVSNSRRAHQAAAYLGVKGETVHRFAAEAKSTRDTTRVITTSEDTEEEIRERLERGLLEGDGDVIRRDDPVEERRAELEAGSPERAVSSAAATAHALADRLDGVGYTADDGRAQRATESREIDVSRMGLLQAMRPALGLAGVAVLLYAAVDRLPGWLLGYRESVPQELLELIPFGARAATLSGLSGLAETEISLLLPGVVVGLAILIGGARYLHSWRQARSAAADARPDGGDSEEESLPWEAKFKMWRMDTAASLQTGDLVWQFAVPAALAFGALVLIAGIWLRWWVYPLLLSGAVFIGAANYARITKSRERELRALRADDSPEAWDACSVLVKHVEAGSATMSYAWFNGDGYAHENAAELADHLAPRVRQLLSGEEPNPSICRKYYRNVRDMYPDLKGWRDNVEEHQISTELLERVESAPDGIMPRDKLIEDVVLHDKEPGLLGLYQTGLGYDPELVRECYRELHPWGLVEETMEIEGSDGEVREVTAVRLRTDPLPPELSEVRANFASRFRAYANWEPLFEPPDPPEPSEEFLVQPGFGEHAPAPGGSSD